MGQSGGAVMTMSQPFDNQHVYNGTIKNIFK